MVSFVKILGCPIQIQVNIFNSLGIPNNWNQLLGILSWLCQVVEEKMEIEKSELVKNYNVETDFIVQKVAEEYTNASEGNI